MVDDGQLIKSKAVMQTFCRIFKNGFMLLLEVLYPTYLLVLHGTMDFDLTDVTNAGWFCDGIASTSQKIDVPTTDVLTSAVPTPS